MPPSVPANRRASLSEPSHFIMQLCPHLSLAISGFLLMADSRLHQSRPGKQVTVGAGRVGAVQSPFMAYATFSGLQRCVESLNFAANQVTPAHR